MDVLAALFVILLYFIHKKMKQIMITFTDQNHGLPIFRKILFERLVFTSLIYISIEKETY